jgi:hypothetical protein
VPTAALPPAIPFTSHASADPVGTHSDALKVCEAPNPTLAGEGEIEFVAAQAIVAVAFPDFVPSAALVAVTVTVAGKGGAAGAVYNAVVPLVVVTVPTVEFPPGTPFTLQVNPAAGSPLAVIVAVNTCAPPAGTLAVSGTTEIEMSSSKITLADPLSAASAALTAVTVTRPPVGIAVGAV